MERAEHAATSPISLLLLIGVLLGHGPDEALGQGQPARPAAGGRSPAGGVSLVQARKGFRTKIVRKRLPGEPLPQPPPALFRLVKYDSPVGKLGAYLTPDPKDNKQHPAIVWITGGDSNTIDESLWVEGPPENDQSATAFRKAGIVTMFPSLRGGNDNPGVREGFFGEVDDILAAAKYLAQQPYVDPRRIYLGGHSTGGTLVLLTAECSDRFRAVFSFGPVENPAGYGTEYCPFDMTNRREIELRSPGRWLQSIRSPVFVLEGTDQGNMASMRTMTRASRNPKVRFIPVEGANHFSLLAPTSRIIAAKILRDRGPTSTLTLSREELSRAVSEGAL